MMIRRPTVRPLPPIMIVHMERTMCNGTCPVYKVRVDDNGEVNWNGIDFVEVTGRRLWAISKAKLRLLHKLLEEYDFMNLDKPDPSDGPFFGGYITCQPSCITTVIFRDGTRKKIDHYLGDGFMPKRLEELENRIDAILGTHLYIGSNPPLITNPTL